MARSTGIPGLTIRGKTYWMNLTDAYGDPHRESTHIKVPDLDKAKAFFEQRKSVLASGTPYTPFVPKAIALSALCKLYKDSLPNRKTKRNVEKAVRALIRVLGDVRVHTISPEKLQNFVTQRLDIDKASPNTVRTEMAYFRAALRHGERLKRLHPDVVKALVAIKRPKAKRTTVRVFTVNEFWRLLVCSPYWFQLVILATLLSGFRCEDVAGATWTQVNLAGGQWRMPAGKGITLRNGPMLSTVWALLKAMRGDAPEDSPILVDENGRPLTVAKLDKAFHGTALRARVNNASFHDLRHSFASWHSMNGVLLEVIQQLLGHASIAPTMIYVHFTPSFVLNQIRDLDRLDHQPTPPRIEYRFRELAQLLATAPDDGLLHPLILAALRPEPASQPLDAPGETEEMLL